MEQFCLHFLFLGGILLVLDSDGNDVRAVSTHEAVDILGRETFLSGISRSAFHFTCVRESPEDGTEIYFDSSIIFKEQKRITMKKNLREKIPNFDTLYDALKEFVLSHQGKKGYIDCQPSRRLDNVFAVIYDDEEGRGVEHYVYAVRVIDGDVEVLLEPILRSHLTVYGEGDFHSEETEGTRGWFSLRSSDVYYVQTLLSICESIEEYV